MALNPNIMHMVPGPDWHHVLVLRWHSPDAGLRQVHTAQLAEPEDIRNGHGVHLLLPGSFSDEAYQRLLRHLEPALGRVRMGYTSEWDGVTHVGHLTERAEDALLVIDRLVKAFSVSSSTERPLTRH